MKNLFFLIILFFTGIVFIKADEASLNDEDFISALEQVKNPFMVDLPKPVAVPEPLVKAPVQKEPQPVKPVVLAPEVISLPDLQLKGVVVGEEIHQAIINDTVVPLQGIIEGARVISVTKDGVGLLYKGKKFFLKAD